MKPIDFTVVIPTFRRPAELREAISSVLAQSEVEIEIIVVDDSPERSAESVIASINDARVAYLANPNPSGGFPSAVRNLGWPSGRGDFVHFLDDDDVIPPGHYAAVKHAFAKHPNVGVVFCRIDPSAIVLLLSCSMKSATSRKLPYSPTFVSVFAHDAPSLPASCSIGP
ncbi:glycosyltransferase family A protein [Bradyrhizobium centrolobii]|uniref:glycosyltransferase family A protein n=1 Tax=Bradyrhizobium centrolobii TaxID=1505087 RepID=UPI0013747446|nr:glycosyltransferase family A protein [Bradyrhizobium centrolobii]